MRYDDRPLIGYVVKVYPRFSETFIVTEILAREALGERIEILALRPTTDTRFHGELARVQAPVRHIERPRKTLALWQTLQGATTDPALARAISANLLDLLALEVDDAAQSITVAAHVREHGITHLHAHFASAATTVARMAARLAGIPYSFTAHAKDLYHDSVSRPDLARKLHDAAFTVTVSDYNAEHLAREFPALGTVHRVYNGLELARFPYTPRLSRGTPLRLLTVGRLVEKKGFADLIDAVGRVRDLGHDVELEIVGEGELHDDLAGRVAASPHSPSITLTGPLPQDAVAAKLRDADVFVAPCRVAADGNVDGLPTVLLEAMATGTPCISTAVTGIPEIIRHRRTGLLCAPGDVAALTEAIVETTAADFPVDRITASARAVVETDFDAARQAAQLATLTTSTLLAGRSAA